jgi:hypothetical protein
MESADHATTGMNTANRALHAVVTELEALLRGDGENHWADWMQRVIIQLEQGDQSAPESLLRAYGGMGSFNDLALGQDYSNGHFQWRADAGELNERLDALRGRAWELARAIRDATASPR